MKKIFFIFIFLIGTLSFSAQELDQYKYVIVPEAFDFSKEENQYKLNALTKFLFEKHGFSSLMKKEEKPVDLQENYCLALKAIVKNNSGLFVTKMLVQLEDCHGNIVFETKEGRSREKDYRSAWHEALRDAFSDIAELDYHYSPAEGTSASAQIKKEPKPEAVEKAEVGKSVPATQSRQLPARAKEENVPAEVVVNNPMTDSPSAKGLELQKEGITYFLEKSDSGYNLFRQNSEEPFAVLISSADQENYIYKSLTRQGLAYFDEGGNLVVEYLNENTSKTIKQVYTIH